MDNCNQMQNKSKLQLPAKLYGHVCAVISLAQYLQSDLEMGQIAVARDVQFIELSKSIRSLFILPQKEDRPSHSCLYYKVNDTIVTD